MTDLESRIPKYTRSELAAFDFETPDRSVYNYIVVKRITKEPLAFAMAHGKVDGFNASRTEEGARATAVFYDNGNTDGYPQGERFCVVAINE